MPRLNITTKEANSVWKSPDGQREIFEVVMDYNGTAVKASTYSKDIATVGWSGEIESYEKEGKAGRPSQTFVKQPQKEGFTGGYQRPTGADTRGTPNSKFGGDQFTMFLSYAKDLAVAMLDKTGKVDKAAYAEVLADVVAGGHVLYEARPGAKPEVEQASTTSEVPVKPEPVIESVEEVDESIQQLSAVFGDVENLTPDKPWAPNSSK